MNNEKNTSRSIISSLDSLSSIVLQKALIKALTESVPVELQKYRLPNLVDSYLKRMRLARQTERNARIPPTRIVISDFSKKPIEAERLSNIRGIMSKEKKKSARGSKKISKKLTSVPQDRRRKSSLLGVTSRDLSNSRRTSTQEIPASGGPKIQRRQSIQINSIIEKRTKIFVRPMQLRPPSFSNTVFKTRVKLKDFSRTIKTEPKTSSRVKQLKEIDDLMIALNDTQISRKALEMALLVPEEVVKSKVKLDYKDFEYIRSWTPEPTLAAHRLASSAENSSNEEKEPVQVRKKIEKSPLSDNFLPVINNSASSHKSVVSQRRVISKAVAPKVQKSRSAQAKNDTGKKASKPHSLKKPQATPRKAQTVSFAKMVVKPLDLLQSDSDQYLDRNDKPKTRCWWNASEIKELRTKLFNKKESDKQMKTTDHSKNDKFKTANQIQRPNAHTAHQNTKYLKSPISIDQLPIEPQLDRQFIKHTQAVAQGRNQFRNSIWLPSQRQTSRPKSASLFHMENESVPIIRRRTFSMGNQKIGAAVELPSDPSPGYLQIYAPREHHHHLI